MIKKLYISLLIAVAVIAVFVSGCAQEANIQITAIPVSADGQSTLQSAPPYEASPLPIVSGEAPLPSGMTVYNTFFADLDNNGVAEKIIIGGVINEYGEDDISLTIFNGYDLIQTEVDYGYFMSAFLTRTQSGEACVFISVDRASNNYETNMLSFNGLNPVSQAEIGGYVSKVSGTYIKLENITDVFGSWWYYSEFLLIDSFDLKPATDCVITMGVKEPLHTIKKLPVEMLVNGAYVKQMLPEDKYIYPKSTDCKSYMIFELENGSEGKINFSFQDYTLCIDSINEEEYFDNIEYSD